MHQHAMEWNFIFTNTDRLLKIFFSHYRLGTDKCGGYWTCGWKTKVRAVQPCAAAAPLGVFLNVANLAHSSCQYATASIFNQSWFSQRFLDTAASAVHKKKLDVWERFCGDTWKKGRDVATMSCKQWVRLKRLASTLAGVLSQLDGVFRWKDRQRKHSMNWLHLWMTK